MKVKKVIDILSKLRLILQQYEDKTVEQMLDDIYMKVSMENSGHQLISSPVKAKKDGFNAAEIAGRLSGMSKEERTKFLQGLTKPRLQKVAACFKVKLSMGDRKDSMISTINEHFGFSELNQRIADRTPQDNEEFLQKVWKKIP